MEQSNNRGRAEEGVVAWAAGFPVHSQVRRIKLESEGMMVDGPNIDLDLRPVSWNIKRQPSRSPLGLSSSMGRAISVCD